MGRFVSSIITRKVLEQANVYGVVVIVVRPVVRRSSVIGLLMLITRHGKKSGDKSHEKWSAHNAGVVSKDTTSNLSREEKGVVSSVFAKVIEGKNSVENPK